MENDYDYEKLKEIGRISSEALSFSRSIIKEGASLLEVAEKIEDFIREKNCSFSFPVNISINEQAAHYTPNIDDKSTFGKNDLVKIDLGARRDVYLTDCAITIDLSGNNQKLVEASEKALENAINTIKSGRKVNEIGREIEKVAKEYGFRPIRNLGGHGIDTEELHSHLFIPNYDNGDETKLEEGDVVAIEPFMTTGEGYVQNGETLEIFQKTNDISARAQETREVAKFIGENYKTYPFAFRWLFKGLKNITEFRIRRAVTEMLQAEALEPFPVLVEKGKGMVSQAEKEVIVEKDSCTIVTK